MRRSTCSLLLFATLLAAGCGEHRRTVVVPSSATPGTHYPAQPPTTSAPANTASTTPSTSTTQPGAPTTQRAQVRIELLGPGPRRVGSDARDVVALQLRLTNSGPDAAALDGLRVAAAGRLDDPVGVATLRLVEDRDGDGAFDRNVDRVVASAGFAQDDGQAAFLLASGLPLPSSTSIRLLILVDLSGRGRSNDDLRLSLGASDVTATTSAGGAATVELAGGAGPLLTVGGWVAPHLAFAVPGDGLFPRAVRDAQGRTHVAIYQNHNGNSDVWYSVFDGRRYSPVDDVSRAPRAAWNQDLAVEAGLPHLIWEEWDSTINDYAIRYSRFDATNFGWTAAEAVSAGRGTSLVPRIVVVNGVVHAAWEQTSPGGTPRVYYRQRSAAGWSAIAEVSSANATARAEKPALARLPGDLVTIAWSENDTAQSQIVTRTWSAAGLSRREVAASAQSTAERPQLLSVGADLHLAFETGGEAYHAWRAAQGWSRPTNVSRSPTRTSAEPTLVLHAGAVHAVWIEDETGPSGNTATQVAYAASVGGGFGPVELLTRGLGARSYPVAVSEGDRLKVLWQDWSLGRQRIFSTWREPSRLEAPRVVASPGGDPQRPAAARGDAGQLVVAYGLDAGGNHEVFAQTEARAGLGFTRAENVSRSATPSYKPTVAVVASTAWIAWEEDLPQGFTIRVAHATSTGWSQPASVSSASPAYGPRLLKGSTGPIAVWTEHDPVSGTHRVTTRTRTASGWGAPVRLSPAGADAWSPSAALTEAGELVAIWEDEQAGRRRIRLATQDRAGAIDVAFVASSASGQWAPAVAAQGRELHAVWVEDGRVRVARRPAGAAAFDPPVDLSTSGCWSPDIAVSNEVVVATWEQWSGSDARAMHAVLTASGWSTPAPVDLSAGPSRRTRLLGTARGGVQLLWTTPGSVWLRERRED